MKTILIAMAVGIFSMVLPACESEGNPSQTDTDADTDSDSGGDSDGTDGTGMDDTESDTETGDTESSDTADSTDSFSDSDSESETEDTDSETDSDTGNPFDCSGDPCDPNATCNDSGQIFVCTCNDGWEGTGLVCSDVNECEEEEDDCDETHGTCTNSAGSYSCGCESGWHLSADTECLADAACTNGDTRVGSTVCGVNANGFLEQLCTEGQWEDTATCIDDDVCLNGSTRNGTTICGPNDNGVLRQTCASGQWENTATCIDDDVCENGDTRDGTTPCGLNDAGRLEQACTGGQWEDTATCVNDNVCENGNTRDGTTPCGINGDGVYQQLCTAGQWNNTATCIDDDVCLNGSTRNGTTSCGINGAGVLQQLCQEGGWTNTATCIDDDVCVNGITRDGTTPCGNGGVLEQLCTAGQWADTANCVNEIIDTDTIDTETVDTETVDTETVDTDTEPQTVMIGSVARGGGVYALEFTDGTDTWYFACKAEHGGRITDYELNGVDMLASSAVNASNYGSIFWVSPQSLWGWPPPADMNDNTWTVSVNESAYTVTLSRNNISIGGYNVGISKTFSVDLAEKAVVLSYTIINQAGSARSYAPWEVTRVLPDGLSFYPMGTGSVSSGSFSMFPNTNISGTVWCNHANISAAGDYKLFSDGADGWLAHTDGSMVFVKKFSPISAAQAASGEAEIELYGNLTYEEVEMQGAFQSVAAGASYTWGDVYWYLRDMPAGASATAGDTNLLNFVTDLMQ